jgi:hypothetical protein
MLIGKGQQALFRNILIFVLSRLQAFKEVNVLVSRTGPLT